MVEETEGRGEEEVLLHPLRLSGAETAVMVWSDALGGTLEVGTVEIKRLDLRLKLKLIPANRRCDLACGKRLTRL